MFKGLTFAVAIAVAALSGVPASAITVPIALEENTGGFFKTVKNAFSYDFTFTLPFAGQLTASLTSSAVTNPIVFSSVTLNGVALIKDDLSNSYSLPIAISAIAGSQTFHVAGTASSKATTFSGTVQFITAIPEPAAWGMMVIGFGALGASLRRRPAAGVITYS